MIKRIEKIFTQVTGITDVNFSEKTRLDKGLKLSSLAMIQMVCAIEDEFGIEVPAEAAEGIKTVEEAVELIKNAAN